MTAKPRERILNAATRLFYQEGIHTVGVDLIISKADVAPMTLYRQFGNKDQLVADTLEHWSYDWLHQLQDAVDQCGDDSEARFSGLWDALEDWFAVEGFRGSYVLNAAVELRGQPNHPAQKVIAEHRLFLHHSLEDLAKVAGVHDPIGLADQLLLLIDGAVTAAVLNGGQTVTTSLRTLAQDALAAALN